MNNTRIDSLSRHLDSGGLTRRSVLKQGSAGLAAIGGLGLTSRVSAQDAAPTTDDQAVVDLLFVQSGGPTTLTPGDDEIHTMTFRDITVQTLYFSDRLNRIAGTFPTEDFVAKWPEEFDDDPPNATLIGHLEVGEEAVVVELMAPEYDAEAGTLTYQVRVLQDDEIEDRVFEQEPLTALEEGREYIEAHLFIDEPSLACDLTAAFTGPLFC